MNREQRRKLAKENKQVETDFLFHKLPDACSSCKVPFDKKSKEMANTWRVVVSEQKRVSLFCPTCIEKTKELLNVVSTEKSG